MEYIIEVLRGECVVTRYVYTNRSEAIACYSEIDAKFSASNSTSVRYKEVKCE